MSQSSGWRVLVDSAAACDLRKVPDSTRQRILTAIGRAASPFPTGQVKKLSDAGGRWRLRVGEWRVILKPVFAERTLVVLRVARRDVAYSR